MKRCLLVLVVGIAVLASLASAGGAVAKPTPEVRKVCSSYAVEHFHAVTAHLPDGTKCLEVGEYCSHAPGFARAYREYGFVCKARLEEI
jgi:hypothetical protein